jgi:hypothetical protein
MIVGLKNGDEMKDHTENQIPEQIGSMSLYALVRHLQRLFCVFCVHVVLFILLTTTCLTLNE